MRKNELLPKIEPTDFQNNNGAYIECQAYVENQLSPNYHDSGELEQMAYHIEILQRTVAKLLEHLYNKGMSAVAVKDIVR